MAIKSDGWIRRMARETGMIEPFADRQVRDGVISYGVSSYGYDMRVADEFRIFHNALFPVVDPKKFDERSFLEYQGDVCIIPPNSFALARSIEYFRIPRSILTICVGEEHLRALRPHRERHALRTGVEGARDARDLEHDPAPRAGLRERGDRQVLFFESDEVCEVSYADKAGKYQGQTGVTPPKL